MEWTLDQENLYSNPLMTDHGRIRIRELCKENAISIPSITGDCFMQAPFWKARELEAARLEQDFIAVCKACHLLGIKQVVVPLVDNGRIENRDHEDRLVDVLSGWQDQLSLMNIRIIFESDFNPKELARLLSRLDVTLFGINYDIGNSAAQGWNAEDEFEAYGQLIVNVHIKDRIVGGSTVPLGTGNADFEAVFIQLGKINYKGNFILQTARSTGLDHERTLGIYRDMTLAWALNYLGTV
jgi:hexulose-6-phosphate isomerase